ncbi:MAG: CxxxxCH/CxxCH domain-containing protein [Muribaculaceae bacterium]|nr:CxxxxCH/CxxCH domain-containing protein [Muribaculaceae bacterium]
MIPVTRTFPEERPAVNITSCSAVPCHSQGTQVKSVSTV